ncbi:MAG: maleylacetoacetate isomerase [Myxococcota bacterium]
MKLYGYWRSSSSWRVRIALNLKGLKYEQATVHLVRNGGEQHSDAYQAKNPLEQVPCLELGDGTILTQSVAIVEYLDELHPTPPLFPGDSLRRARTRELIEISNSAIQPMHNLATLLAVEKLGATRPGWAGPHISRGLAAMERIVARTAKTFAMGDLPSAADAVIVPQLYAARRFEVDLAPFPTLQRVEGNCIAVDAFRLAHPDQQPDAPKDN